MAIKITDETLPLLQRIQELERAMSVATTLMLTTAEDTTDYLDRVTPNIPPVLRKVQYMKEYADRTRKEVLYKNDK